MEKVIVTIAVVVVLCAMAFGGVIFATEINDIITAWRTDSIARQMNDLKVEMEQMNQDDKRFMYLLDKYDGLARYALELANERHDAVLDTMEAADKQETIRQEQSQETIKAISAEANKDKFPWWVIALFVAGIVFLIIKR